MPLTPMVPRYPVAMKHCFVYCGDDRCDCGKGPRGRILDDLEFPASEPERFPWDSQEPAETVPDTPAPVLASGLPPYPPTSVYEGARNPRAPRPEQTPLLNQALYDLLSVWRGLNESQLQNQRGYKFWSENHHRGVNFLRDVALHGSVRLDVLGPKSSLDHPHERVLHDISRIQPDPIRRVLYRLRVRNNWIPIADSAAPRDGTHIEVAADVAGDLWVREWVYRGDGMKRPEAWISVDDGEEIHFEPTHWRYVNSGKPA